MWDRPFASRLERLLRPGMAILDIGAGRRPTLPVAERPEGTVYAGLDVDAAELEAAQPGSYDETVVSPAEERVEGLVGRFDLVLSFFAFEHVESTERVLESIHAYLRPGGTLLAQLAGKRSPFSVANRILPRSASRRLLRGTQGRDPDSVFPARYDRCTHSELTGLLEAQNWEQYEVLPLFTGAGYVVFSRAITAAYIAYEEWLYRRKHRDLAPYYLIDATR
jgi:SAM-dependent methyltransferase